MRHFLGDNTIAIKNVFTVLNQVGVFYLQNGTAEYTQTFTPGNKVETLNTPGHPIKPKDAKANPPVETKLTLTFEYNERNVRIVFANAENVPQVYSVDVNDRYDGFWTRVGYETSWTYGAWTPPDEHADEWTLPITTTVPFAQSGTTDHIVARVNDAGVKRYQSDLNETITTWKLTPNKELQAVSSEGGINPHYVIEAVKYRNPITGKTYEGFIPHIVSGQSLAYTHQAERLVEIVDGARGQVAFYKLDKNARRVGMTLKETFGQGLTLRNLNTSLDALGREAQVFDTQAMFLVYWDKASNRMRTRAYLFENGSKTPTCEFDGWNSFDAAGRNLFANGRYDGVSVTDKPGAIQTSYSNGKIYQQIEYGSDVYIVTVPKFASDGTLFYSEVGIGGGEQRSADLTRVIDSTGALWTFFHTSDALQAFQLTYGNTPDGVADHVGYHDIKNDGIDDADTEITLLGNYPTKSETHPVGKETHTRTTVTTYMGGDTFESLSHTVTTHDSTGDETATESWRIGPNGEHVEKTGSSEGGDEYPLGVFQHDPEGILLSSNTITYLPYGPTPQEIARHETYVHTAAGELLGSHGGSSEFGSEVNGGMLQYGSLSMGGHELGMMSRDEIDVATRERMQGMASDITLPRDAPTGDHSPLQSPQAMQNAPVPAQRYYEVQDGDTYSSIAQQVYGNAALGALLAIANGQPGVTTPREHMRIELPYFYPKTNRAGEQIPYARVVAEVNGRLHDDVSFAPPKEHDDSDLEIVEFLAIAIAVVVGQYEAAAYFGTAAAAGGAAATGSAAAGTTAGAAAGTAGAAAGASSGAVAGAAAVGTTTAVTVESESVAAGVASLTDLSEQGLMEGFHMENHIDWTDVFDAGLDAGTYGLGRGVGIPKEVLDQVMKSVATQLIGLATGAQTKFDFVALRNAAIEATVDGELNQATGLDADNQAVEEGADTALNAGMTTALTGRAPNLEMVVDEALVSTIEDEAIAKIHAESQSETNKTSGKGKNKLDQQRKRDQAVGKSTPKSDAARSQQPPESQERHSLKAHDKTIKQLDKENKAKKQASSWKKPDAKPKTHASVVASRTKSQAKTGYEGVASAKASQRQSVVSQRQTRMQRWGSQSSTSKWQELKAFVKGVANESARRLVGDAEASMDKSISGLAAGVTKLMVFESLTSSEKLQVLESYADAQIASLHRLDSEYESNHGVSRAYLLGEGSSALAAKAIGLFAILGTDGDVLLEEVSDANEGARFSMGGKYSQVRKAATRAGVGGEVHHMPADSISPLSKREGPSIWMEKDDHALTGSFGYTSDSRKYRLEQKALIESGRFRDAIAKDIRDIRSIFGSFYNGAIQEMLDYARNYGLIDKATMSDNVRLTNGKRY